MRTQPMDYGVGWICAINLERLVASSMLDEEYVKSKEPLIDTSKDHNSYTFGRIHEHNVVIASLPQGRYGITSAAIVATHMQLSFPDLQIRLMVGIAGGAPSDNHDIRLGDVVVSSPTPVHGSVIQYDLGRAVQNHEFEITSHLAPPPDKLLNAIAHLRAKHSQVGHRIAEKVAQMLQGNSRLVEECNRPSSGMDRLYSTDYDHSDQEKCDCLRVGDADSKDGLNHPSLISRRVRRQSEDNPVIHYGLIASANAVMKDANARDALIKRHDVLCFEMEAAGLMNSFSCVVIRGICDYSDTHKNDSWQGYAAATAATYAKELLEIIPGKQVRNIQSVGSSRYNISFGLQGLPIPKKFVDRPMEMRMLEEALLIRSNQRKAFVLRGPGGIGKTQLAVHFMRKHHTKFSAALWLDGSSIDSLKQSIGNLASKIPLGQISDAGRGYAHSGEGDLDEIVQEVLNWLGEPSNHRWLLIFDNVDREFDSSELDPLAYDINKFLPSADHGSVLVTTRLTRLEQLGESQEVRKVDEATAYEILKIWYKRAVYESDIKQLLGHLDGLPLAIAQAGAYLHESGMNPRAYLDLYKEQREEVAAMLHGSNASVLDYPGRSVWTTWIISYNSILARNKDAAHMLVLWSFWDCSDIWYGIFERAFHSTATSKALSEWLGNVVRDRLSFVNTMALLRSYSLIEGSDEGDGYRMHAVVHRWAYFYQGLRHQDVGMLALVVVGLAVPTNTERDHNQLQQRLLPHAQGCLDRVPGLRVVASENFNFVKELASQFDQQLLEPILTALIQLGMLHMDRFKLHEAEKLYLLALVGCEEVLESDNKWTLQTLNDLGMLYEELERYDEAEKMYIRALAGRRRVLGTQHVSTLNTVSNLGLLYFLQAKFDEAEKTTLQVLVDKEKALGPEHLSTLQTVGNLGWLYSEQGKPDEAEKMLLRAQLGSEKALGPTDIFTLKATYNLGELYSKRGRFNQAEAMLQRAVVGFEHNSGLENKLTLCTMVTLGKLYYNHGKLNEAEQILLQALAGHEKTLGSTHTSTLQNVTNLGELYSKQGKLYEAEAMLQRAIVGLENAVGIGLRLMLHSCSILGRLYYNHGKRDEAEKMLLRALKGFEEVLGLKQMDTYLPALETMESLGDFYSETRPKESQAMYTKALAGYTVIKGATSDVCISLEQRLRALNTIEPTDVEHELIPALTTSSDSNNYTSQRRGSKVGIIIQKLRKLSVSSNQK